MKTSQAGLELIKLFESFRAKPYLPTVHDVATVGFGTTVYPTGQRVHLEDAPVSEATALKYLAHDVTPCEEVIRGHVAVDLTQHQFDALVSFIYNVGQTAFENSTLLKRLNGHNFAAAADEFLRWDKQAGKTLRGLTRRREAERALFLS